MHDTLSKMWYETPLNLYIRKGLTFLILDRPMIYLLNHKNN